MLHQHAHRADVVQLLETQALPPHLVDDAGDVLGAAADFGLDAVQRDFRLQAFDDAIDVSLAVGAFFVELRGDGLVGVGFQIAERPVLHFPLDLPHAEPVRQRREQLARLLAERRAGGNVLAGSATQGMGAFGQLHQHHADVLHHRQHHLPQRLQLGVRIDTLVGGAGGQRLDARHRGNAAGKPGCGAERGFEFRTVVEAAVQQRRGHRIRPHPQLGHDQRSADAVRESLARPKLSVRMFQRAPGQIVFRHRQHARQRLPGGFEVGGFKAAGLRGFGHGC